MEILMEVMEAILEVEDYREEIAESLESLEI